jgi:hypothetical protein
VSIADRIKRLLRNEDRTVDTDSGRIDNQVAARQGDVSTQSEGGAIPPNYLPTGVDEGRPRK